MKKTIVFLVFSLLPPLASASNFASCLLDKLDGVRNEAAVRTSYQLCTSRHPEGMSGVKWGAGKGFFFSRYANPLECFHDKGKELTQSTAINLVYSACTRLYGEEPRPPKRLVPFSGELDPVPHPSSNAREACEESTPGPWCAYR